MKKEWYAKFLYLLSGLLALGFCVRLIADYVTYDAMVNSAPFYVFILVRALTFLLPAAILLIIAGVCKKKFTGTGK